MGDTQGAPLPDTSTCELFSPPFAGVFRIALLWVADQVFAQLPRHLITDDDLHSEAEAAFRAIQRYVTSPSGGFGVHADARYMVRFKSYAHFWYV